jgi:MFS family permease
MQRTAVSWVIYTLTHSAFMLGLTVFAQQFPSFLLSLWGGIVADRYPKYRILLITQTASLLQAVLLAALLLLHRDSVWAILALSLVLGVINAFDVPARQPMIHDMLNDPDDLTNALSLNSAMVNLARLIGPALSGVILQKFGAGICFSLNAASFIAVLTSLLLMKLPSHPASQAQSKTSAALAEGFTYLKHTPAIAFTLLFLILASLLILPYNTLLPVFAKVIYKGNAATFGYISSFIGAGAMAGTFFLASSKPGRDLKRVLLWSVLLLGIALILFSRINSFPLGMVAAVVCGFSTLCIATGCITIVQVESAKNMRGRMMSYVAMGYFGMLPVGSLLIGAISQRFGAPNAILGQGIAAVFVAALFFRFLYKAKPKGESTQVNND